MLWICSEWLGSDQRLHLVMLLASFHLIFVFCHHHLLHLWCNCHKQLFSIWFLRDILAKLAVILVTITIFKALRNELWVLWCHTSQCLPAVNWVVQLMLIRNLELYLILLRGYHLCTMHFISVSCLCAYEPFHCLYLWAQWLKVSFEFFSDEMLSTRNIDIVEYVWLISLNLVPC